MTGKLVSICVFDWYRPNFCSLHARRFGNYCPSSWDNPRACYLSSTRACCRISGCRCWTGSRNWQKRLNFCGLLALHDKLVVITGMQGWNFLPGYLWELNRTTAHWESYGITHIELSAQELMLLNLNPSKKTLIWLLTTKLNIPWKVSHHGSKTIQISSWTNSSIFLTVFVDEEWCNLITMWNLVVVNSGVLLISTWTERNLKA